MNHNINIGTGARVRAVDAAAASILRAVAAHEGMSLHGIYGIEVYSPPEHLRREYAEMRGRLDALDASSRLVRMSHVLEMRRLRGDIARIPRLLVDQDIAPNLVPTVGKNEILDKSLAGSAYTAAWYLGLIGATGYTTGAAAGDTMASHGGWAEDQTYSNGARITTAWAAASGGSKALSAAAQFNINGSVTEKGCFLSTNSTKGGTTGILGSAGLFTGGDKALGNGDTLSVSYTMSA